MVADDIPSLTKSKISDFSHTHDDRYYTESEMDTKLNGKSNTNHTHTTVNGHTVNSDVPANAKFTDTDTWRPQPDWNASSGNSAILNKPSLGDVAAKTARTLKDVGAIGWTNWDTDRNYIPDMAFMAYWNGAYSGTASNLLYCKQGAFGSAATANKGDFAPAGEYPSAGYRNASAATIDAIRAVLTSNPSFIGSISGYPTTNNWQNVISVRHVNGNAASDGTRYGFYMRTQMDTTQDAIYVANQWAGQWGNERQLADSGTTFNGTLTFGKNDKYGIRTSTHNYGSIGEDGKSFCYGYIVNVYSNNVYTESVCTKSSSSGAHILFNTPNSSWPHLRIDYYDSGFYCRPSSNNSSCLGASDNRYKTVYSYAFDQMSDRKVKENIKLLDPDWVDKFVDGLKPSSYNFIDNTYGKTHTGFIAQEVEELMLSLGMDRKEFAGLEKTLKPEYRVTPEDQDNVTIKELLNDPDNFEGPDEKYDYSLRYTDFIAPLVAYCQNLKKENNELKEEVNDLHNQIDSLTSRLEKIEKLLSNK